MARWTLLARALTLSLPVCFSLPGEVLAGSSAQLRVTARVVNQCTVRLPDRVPDRVVDRLQDLLEHRCAAPVPVHVGTQMSTVATPVSASAPIRVDRRNRGRGAVLVTITY